MNILDDIKPLSFFKQKTSSVVKHIKETKKPTFITINGNVELVVQDAKSYQNMVDYIDTINDVNKIQAGLEDVKNGNYVPAKEGLNMIRQKLNA